MSAEALETSNVTGVGVATAGLGRGGTGDMSTTQLSIDTLTCFSSLSECGLHVSGVTPDICSCVSRAQLSSQGTVAAQLVPLLPCPIPCSLLQY